MFKRRVFSFAAQHSGWIVLFGVVYLAAFFFGTDIALDARAVVRTQLKNIQLPEVSLGYIADVFVVRYALIAALIMLGAGRPAAVAACAVVARKAVDDGIILSLLSAGMDAWRGAAGAGLYLISMACSVPVVLLLCIMCVDASRGTLRRRLPGAGRLAGYVDYIRSCMLIMLLLIPSLLLYITAMRFI